MKTKCKHTEILLRSAGKCAILDLIVAQPEGQTQQGVVYLKQEPGREAKI